jgi:hypothetical protein
VAVAIDDQGLLHVTFLGLTLMKVDCVHPGALQPAFSPSIS